jgi:hypothetical protein
MFFHFITILIGFLQITHGQIVIPSSSYMAYNTYTQDYSFPPNECTYFSFTPRVEQSSIYIEVYQINNFDRNFVIYASYAGCS